MTYSNQMNMLHQGVWVKWSQERVKVRGCTFMWRGHGGLTWMSLESRSVGAERARLRLGTKAAEVTDSCSLFFPGVGWTTHQMWKDIGEIHIPTAKLKKPVWKDDMLLNSSYMTSVKSKIKETVNTSVVEAGSEEGRLNGTHIHIQCF